MSEHEHTEACGSTPEVDNLLAKLNDPGTKLTESQFRELRGRYFTVRHHRVKECGHLLDQINEPTFRNCEYCWFAFFSSHGELVNVTDEAFKEHGAEFVDRLRGKEYRKRFTQYMSTLAAFKLEADALKAQQDANQRIEQELLQEKPQEGSGLEPRMAAGEQRQDQPLPSGVESGEPRKMSGLLA